MKHKRSTIRYIKNKGRRKTKGGVKPLNILVTAGPTIEFIDPVRVISNLSTGEMGYRLAEAAKKRGHNVTLISGPVSMKRIKGAKHIFINTAAELEKRLKQELKKNAVLIMTSAVCDFGVLRPSKNKIKSGKKLTLTLYKNKDILASLSAEERRGKILVGFALESKNLLLSAGKKLASKRLDLIVANKIGKGNVPFGKGRKSALIIDKSLRIKRLEKITKSRIAGAILDSVEELCYTPRIYAFGN